MDDGLVRRRRRGDLASTGSRGGTRVLAPTGTPLHLAGSSAAPARVAVAGAATDATAGPVLVPGLRTAGFTAAGLTLLGVAIALTLRRPAAGAAAAALDAVHENAQPIQRTSSPTS
ncbi:hypothetical protein ACFV7R_09040 [Streptomyces sp. NPDC059866]|uniref:hypothetical protein n=1 Tax=Streptomyces sp. NPDC059866 TaxID=3346978 RepID=UPI00364CC22B